MKLILEMNEPVLGARFLKSRRHVLDNGNLYSRHSIGPSHARPTFTRRAPEAVRLVRRIVISWQNGAPFKPELQSAVPIYPRVRASGIGRQIIRRHKIHLPALCIFNDIQ
jgi:hypothetical protein